MTTIRVVLDLRVGTEGELSGTVEVPDGRELVPFVGWLALLAVLERTIADPVPRPAE